MGIVVRPLAAADLPAASRINRAAFSKFFGIPEPAKFRVGADVIGPRWRLWPEAGVALDLDGKLAAAGLMIRWGSVAILGPVVVAPEHWSKGLARAVMPKLLETVGRGDFAFTGLVTHPQSPKHVRLYETFGFRMQRITAVMAKPVAPVPAAARLFSRLSGSERAQALVAMRELTDAVLFNPYALDEFANALRMALTMPPEEQQLRMKRMRAQVADNNVYRWAGMLLSEAGKLVDSRQAAAESEQRQIAESVA